MALERPPELASDRARAYDVALHALRTLEAEGRGPFDALGLMQCTSPFTAPEDLAGAVELLEETGAGSVVSVTAVEAAQHPLKLKRMEGDRLLPFLEDDALLPSHDLPPLFVRNGSIYLVRRAGLEAGGLVTDDVRGFLMPAERSYDIDTQDRSGLCAVPDGNEASGRFRGRMEIAGHPVGPGRPPS